MTSPGGSRKELDSMVVEIELTLCSIIQGVALYFLVENARAVVSMGQVSAWPYVATGLIIILLHALWIVVVIFSRAGPMLISPASAQS